jgi:hypothetical protein
VLHHRGDAERFVEPEAVGAQKSEANQQAAADQHGERHRTARQAPIDSRLSRRLIEMTNIDWAFAGANLLWIFGASLILAAFSYHVWLSQEARRSLSAQLVAPSWRLTLNLGLSLMVVSITVMPRSERWFTRLIALIIASMLAVIGISRWWRTTSD